jgi:hypothetical protein
VRVSPRSKSVGGGRPHSGQCFTFANIRRFSAVTTMGPCDHEKSNALFSPSEIERLHRVSPRVTYGKPVANPLRSFELYAVPRERSTRGHQFGLRSTRDDKTHRALTTPFVGRGANACTSTTALLSRNVHSLWQTLSIFTQLPFILLLRSCPAPIGFDISGTYQCAIATRRIVIIMYTRWPISRYATQRDYRRSPSEI